MSENKEKEAVKYLVYQFDKGEKVDLENESKIISLTGNKHVDIYKKQLKNTSVFVIIAANRNNNTSKPVRLER